ncbi:hypothetical protein E2P81_ATG09060 [Venturia nashicola]|uniref:Nucleoside-diphosphate-sugar epimerase n=1 Tax=Venturia nashicola TaxID=86259 RepID=A0A4Z1NFL5_9PEZI|nr:hypothetical protein E6O75_ATG09260 [Venturia nashicola]TLD19990.1 hypothetical protein E2P81_ATG09060 [Venturia nashicola]
MKVIVTGTTGLVGSIVLRECIKNPQITSIIAFSRCPLLEELSDNEKVSVITHEDFSHYSDELLDELSGAEACLWAIGGRAGRFSNVQTAKKVQVEFTLAAANAFASKLLPALDEGKDFKFVFCSAGLAVRDQDTSLWVLQDTRKLKGLTENGLLKIAGDNPRFTPYFMRPAHIHPEYFTVGTAVMNALFPSIRVKELAMVMVDTALHGNDKQTLENADLLQKSRIIQNADYVKPPNHFSLVTF